jgi:hypothetical protein
MEETYPKMINCTLYEFMCDECEKKCTSIIVIKDRNRNGCNSPLGCLYPHGVVAMWYQLRERKHPMISDYLRGFFSNEQLKRLDEEELIEFRNTVW